MHPKQYMIYSDMDGTLLTSWEKGPIISEKNQQAITQFINQGGLFSIATGRNKKNGPTYFKHFALELPMVLINGALIYDQINDKNLRKMSLDRDFINEAIAYVEDHDHVALVISDEYEVYHLTTKINTIQQRPSLDFVTREMSGSDSQSVDILKVTFVTYPEDKDGVMNDIKEMKNYPKVSISPSSRRFIEIVHVGVNKAEAMQYIKKHRDYRDRKLVCIGDYLNDEEMLDHADIAAIPLNGLDRLKKEGRIITRHHEEDAIADLIEQLSKLQ